MTDRLDTGTDRRHTANWKWADQLFLESDFGDIFEVDDCEYDADEDEHLYFDSNGNCLTVDWSGNVLIG